MIGKGTTRVVFVIFGVGLFVLFASCEKTTPYIDTPIVNFSGEPREGNEPLVVKFTDLSESKGSQIVAWFWDFGDGETSSLPNPVKTYYHNPADGNNPSFYSVKLRITTDKGTSERTEINYIRVNPGTTFTVLDPNQDSYTGLVTGYGVVLKVPQGALKQKTIFSINRIDKSPTVKFSEEIEVVSNYYRIAHNSPDENMFAKEGDKIIPTTLEVPLLPSETERIDRPSNRYILLALFEDGSIEPILGERKGGYVVSSITGLPSEAVYFVGFFPKALITSVAIEAPENVEVKYPWSLKWKVFGSETAIKQIVALENGDVDLPGSFYRENFSESEVEEVSGKIVEKLLKVYFDFLAAGLKNPILVDIGDGAYGLVLFNINSEYTSNYESFSGLKYGSCRFGNITIDPKQLLMVSIHNALSSNDNPDIKQKFTLYNAFAQYLFYSCYKNYRLLDVSIPDFSLPGYQNYSRMISYMGGLGDSLAIYFGQRGDKVSTDAETGVEIRARAFDESEYYDLTQTLFQPIAEGKKGYYKAGHEFWVFLDRYLTKNYSDISPTFVIGGFLKGLENIFESLNPRQVVTYELLVKIVYSTLDEALRTATSSNSEPKANRGKQGEDNNKDDEVGLSDVYWRFARGKGFERDNESLLRPSDEKIEKFEPDYRMFSVLPISESEIPAPTDVVNINSSTIPELNNVLPCSSRVIKIKVNPMSFNCKVMFYPQEWVKDKNGNSLKIAIYQPALSRFYLLEKDGIDTNSDGINDQIVLEYSSSSQEKKECFNYLYLLVSNVSLDTVSPIGCTFTTKAGNPYPESMVLKKYVEECDPYYEYELINTGAFTQLGVSSYVLRMTSGMWRGKSEVENAVPWSHYVTIVEPSIVLSDKALLVVTGGSSTGEPDILKLANFAFPFVSATGTVACFVKAIPNQPLKFVDDTKERKEDGIIAYSFDKYLRSYESDEPDMTWPALLPMVRSAVRAMDTIQDFVKYKKPGKKIEINKFIVTGASKRGWTSWLTSAIDQRVCAVIPIVIDVLNMPLQIEHHYSSYGFYSSALEDYVEFGIFDRLNTPEGDSLWRIVDPIHYVDFLLMPKFIVNSTGDQFFLPDSAKFYFNLLKPFQILPNGVSYPTNAYLYYAPNTDHSISSSDSLDIDQGTLKSMLAFYISEVNNRERPKFVWWVEEDTSQPDISKRAYRIRLDAITKPKEVLLWQATNKNSRDFRLQTTGLNWTSRKLKPFCAECGGDPGFDYESIFENYPAVSTPKSNISSETNSLEPKFMLGNIRDIQDLRWIYLEGDYYQMGLSYGYLLREKIISMLSTILSTPDTVEMDISGKRRGFPESWIDIIRGISDAIGLSFDEVIRAQYKWSSLLTGENWVSNGYIQVGYQTTLPLALDYIIAVWKPIGTTEEFITLDPIGIICMNFIIRGEETLVAVNNNMNLVEKISYAFKWINSDFEIQRVNGLDYHDFIYWDGNNYNYVKVKNEKFFYEKLLEEANFVNTNSYVYKFEPGRGKLIFSNVDVNLNDLLCALMNNQLSDLSNSGEFSITKIDTNSLSILEKYATYQSEGEGGSECVCEFDENEVYSYVATVPVPEKGWTAFFVQIKFPGPERYIPELKDIDYVFSTRVVVVPDVYPSERE